MYVLFSVTANFPVSVSSSVEVESVLKEYVKCKRKMNMKKTYLEDSTELPSFAVGSSFPSLESKGNEI